jgi:inhibitor of cysteine peptidase
MPERLHPPSLKYFPYFFTFWRDTLFRSSYQLLANRKSSAANKKEGNMKTKLMAILAVILVVMGAGACASGIEANKDTNIVVPLDEFAGAKNIQKQVEIQKEAVLNIILGSNPTTGYSWTEVAVFSDAAVVNQTGHAYIEPGKTSIPVLGAAGHERWTFKGIEAGVTKITLQYARPWEKDVPPEWTFELTVTVK